MEASYNLEQIITHTDQHVTVVRNNLDVMATIVAYLNRKVKFKLSGLSRDFRDHVVPRTMVSLAFKGHDCLT